MKLMTIDDLKLLTREQLIELLERVSFQLGRLAEGSAARADALQTLENIRVVLARRRITRRPLRAPSP